MSQYDLIVVGTGFGSAFFLQRYLQRAPANTRVLVLERARARSLDWQIANRRNSDTPQQDTYRDESRGKVWIYTPNFGGGSNCWWGNTPRMLPADFELQSRYGVGDDWPISYEDLEPYYCDAEDVMSVSGDSSDTPFQRSREYPQPPHRFTLPEERLKAAYPQQFFHAPTARARVATGKRNACCATAACHLCPVKAKFAIQQDMVELFRDPRITLQFESRVDSLLMQAGEVQGVAYRQGEQQKEAKGNLVALGANAIFNPHIMLRSGIDHPWLGKGLNEQMSKDIVVELDGLKNWQGSTSLTAHGYMLYDGEHRRERAAMLIETQNIPKIRLEQGRWQERLVFKVIAEDLLDQRNAVFYDPTTPELPRVVYEGYSDYTQRAFDHLPKVLGSLLAPLPVESVHIESVNPTEAHIQGTTRMGKDPASSVCDGNLRHHQKRNLLLLGSGVFPTCPPANPSLTISALSLRAADRLFDSQGGAS